MCWIAHFCWLLLLVTRLPEMASKQGSFHKQKQCQVHGEPMSRTQEAGAVFSGSQHRLSKRSWSYLGHKFSTHFLFSFLLPTVITGLAAGRANCFAATMGARGIGILLGFCGLSLVRNDFCLFVCLVFIFRHKRVYFKSFKDRIGHRT